MLGLTVKASIKAGSLGAVCKILFFCTIVMNSKQ